jgi:hypothetical protein
MARKTPATSKTARRRLVAIGCEVVELEDI